MATVLDMRNQLANCEPYSESPSWVDKVKRMPDNQVIAIWHKFSKFGNFQRSENIKRFNKKKNKAQEPHQITMFEYMEDLPYADE